MCELIQVQALALPAWASFVAELLFRKRCAALVNGARCMQLLPVMIDAHVKYNVCTCTHSRGSSLSEGHCSCSSLLSPERKRVTPCEALSSAHSNHLNHSHAIASCTKPAAGPELGLLAGKLIESMS